MENEFGKKIKSIRKGHGLTQQEFADSLGYAHKSTINKIESGQEDMSYQKILVLLKEYNLTPNELFGDTNQEAKRDSCVVYIHGLFGSSNESAFYSFLSKKYDVIGLDYKDGNPWEVKDVIIKEFIKISKKYNHVYVIANSIGAFYTYMYLSDFKVEKAFFISPLTNMKLVIEQLMKNNHISIEMLKDKNIIRLDDGQVLSYEFYQSLNNKDSWNTKTHIVYGEKDRIVNRESVINFVTDHNASLTIMKNAEHYFHTPGQLKFIKKWMNEYL